MRPQNSFLENFDGNEWRDTRPKNESQGAVESEDQLLFPAKAAGACKTTLEQPSLQYFGRRRRAEDFIGLFICL